MSQTSTTSSAAIVGLTLQNAGAGPLQGGVTTFGQIFQVRGSVIAPCRCRSM